MPGAQCLVERRAQQRIVRRTRMEAAQQHRPVDLAVEMTARRAGGFRAPGQVEGLVAAAAGATRSA